MLGSPAPRAALCPVSAPWQFSAGPPALHSSVTRSMPEAPQGWNHLMPVALYSRISVIAPPLWLCWHCPTGDICSVTVLPGALALWACKARGDPDELCINFQAFLSLSWTTVQLLVMRLTNLIRWLFASASPLPASAPFCSVLKKLSYSFQHRLKMFQSFSSALLLMNNHIFKLFLSSCILL